MAYRGSLKQCVEQAIDRLKSGRADIVIITNNAGAKYYTLYYTSELEAKILNHPTMKERVVMTVTGGELASIIGTAQMKLSLEC